MRGAIIYGAEGRPLRGAAGPGRSSSPPTRSSAPWRPASAGRTCGATAESRRCHEPTPIGHEYVGIVEAVGSEVDSVQPGQFVVGGFLTSDNTCAVCRPGMQSNCLHGTGYDGCQAELIRVQNADGTLVATPEHARRGDDARASWPCPTSCAPAGTRRSAPTSGPEARSWSSGTGP